MPMCFKTIFASLRTANHYKGRSQKFPTNENFKTLIHIIIIGGTRMANPINHSRTGHQDHTRSRCHHRPEIDAGGNAQDRGSRRELQATGCAKGMVVNIDKTVKSIERSGRRRSRADGGRGRGARLCRHRGRPHRNPSTAAASSRCRCNDFNEITRPDVDRVGRSRPAPLRFPSTAKCCVSFRRTSWWTTSLASRIPWACRACGWKATCTSSPAPSPRCRIFTRAWRKAGLKVSGVVLEPLASSYAVLEDDERESSAAP